MANTNSTYIGKNAQPLVNPTTATVFTQTNSAIATVALTQTPKAVFLRYAGYLQTGSGTSNNINIVRIFVRASGRVTYGAVGNFTPSVVIAAPGATAAPSPTVGTNITLGTLTPQAASAAGTGTWAIDLSLLWDPNSGIIAGTVGGFETTLINGTATTTLTASAAITPATGYTGVAPLTTLPTTAIQNSPGALYAGESQIFFMPAGLFSASNAGNVVYLDNFEVEVA